MSVARSSMAFSSRSLTARTTGAPLARSRRLSISSLGWAGLVSSRSGAASVSSPSRSASAVAISSKDATASATGAAERELCGTHAGCVGRIGDDQSVGAAFLELAWKNGHLAQEAVRKLVQPAMRRQAIGAGRAAATCKNCATSSAKSSAERSVSSQRSRSLLSRPGRFAAVSLARRSPVMACRRARYPTNSSDWSAGRALVDDLRGPGEDLRLIRADLTLSRTHEQTPIDAHIEVIHRR